MASVSDRPPLAFFFFLLSKEFSGILIPTLQGALISNVHVKTTTKEDLSPPSVKEIGWEALVAPPATKINSMGLTSAMIDYLIDATYTTSFDELATNIWTTRGQTQTPGDPLVSMADSDFFISLLPAGTDSGVLHQLALRINSSLTCNTIPRALFPSPCSGLLPFHANFSVPARVPNASENTGRSFSFRVCVPDPLEASFSFWQDDRNRQDITETMYIDLSDTNPNFSYMCILNTTAGYFELPNYWNNHTAGEILTTWPRDKFYQDDYFVQSTLPNGTSVVLHHPSSNTADKTRRDSTTRQGPMSLSAMAIFGSGTFFDKIASLNKSADAGRQLCPQLRRPFMGFLPATLNPSVPSSTDPELSCSTYTNGILTDPLLDWLTSILDPDVLYKALRATTTSACKTFTQPDWHSSGRMIYASGGTDIVKLDMSTSAMIIITFLIASQLAGLLSLAIYASTRPTWTESLDGFAMLRIGAAMASELPSISALEAKHIGVLDEKKGWIGSQRSGENLKRLTIGGSMRPRHDELYQLVDAGKRVKLYVRTQRTGGAKGINVYRG